MFQSESDTTALPTFLLDTLLHTPAKRLSSQPSFARTLLQTQRLCHMASPSVVESWVKHINSLMQEDTSSLLWVGVSLLDASVDQFSREILVTHLKTWLEILLSLVKDYSQTKLGLSAAVALSKLFRISRQWSDLYKASVDCLSKFCPIILMQLKDSCNLRDYFHVMNSCCKIFAESFRPYFEEFEAICFDFAEHFDPSIRQSACEGLIYAAIALKKEHYRSQIQHMVQLLAPISSFDSADFGDSKSNKSEAVPESLSASSTEGCHLDNAVRLERRFSFAVTYFKLLLTQLSSSDVVVPLGPLIRLEQTVLQKQVSTSDLKSFSGTVSPHFPLYSILQQLQCSALSLLSVLVSTFRCGILQFMPKLSEILDVLFEDCSYSSKFGAYLKPNLRVSLYDVIETCASSLGAISFPIVQRAIRHALDDLRHFSEEQTKQSKSPEGDAIQYERPAKRQRTKKDSGGGNTSAVQSMSKDSVVVMESCLQCLQALLTVSGSLMDVEDCLELHTLLIALVLKTKSLEIPADRLSSLRCCLYSTLLSALLSPQSVQTPILPQAIQLFKRGTFDGESKVQSICRHALAASRSILHPRCVSSLTPEVYKYVLPVQTSNEFNSPERKMEDDLHHRERAATSVISQHHSLNRTNENDISTPASSSFTFPALPSPVTPSPMMPSPVGHLLNQPSSTELLSPSQSEGYVTSPMMGATKLTSKLTDSITTAGSGVISTNTIVITKGREGNSGMNCEVTDTVASEVREELSDKMEKEEISGVTENQNMTDESEEQTEIPQICGQQEEIDAKPLWFVE